VCSVDVKGGEIAGWKA